LVKGSAAPCGFPLADRSFFGPDYPASGSESGVHPRQFPAIMANYPPSKAKPFTTCTGGAMPKYRKKKSFSRQRASTQILQRNLLIGAATLIVVFAVIAILASRNSAAEVSFPPREMGDPSARVVVEEFADFQCPGCGVFAREVEPRLRAQYVNTGRVRFIFHPYPVVDSYIENGTESHLAALAAFCAGDQNMFWEYHDILYQNQLGENAGSFTIVRLQAFAVQLHLDSMAFNQCMTNQDHLDVLNADIKLANRVVIQYTPSFFINGKSVYGETPDFQWLFDAIDRALLSSGG
jgi:protein-disulfide isomerase